MAWTADYNFKQSFEDTLIQLAAEQGTGFRNAVRLKTGLRSKAHHFDRLGSVEMQAVTSRHQDTPLTPLTHSRRRVTFSDYALAELIDDLDEVKGLPSPQSDYTQRFAQSYNRRLALTLMSAATGNATSVDDDDATATVALPSGQQISAGSAGMTMAKLRQANRILDVNGLPRTDRYIAVSPYAIEDLLQDTTVTSSDFSTLNALQMGGFPENATWMGFKWIVVTDALGGGNAMATPILSKSSNDRTCVAWHKNALGLAIVRDLQIEIDKRADKMNSTQVLVKVSIGATRIEDEGVVSIVIDESV
jgi:hypothetical protein